MTAGTESGRIRQVIGQPPPCKKKKRRGRSCLLAYFGEYQLQQKYRYVRKWTEGDLQMWDNMSTLHEGALDYEPHEPHAMKGCQIPSDWGRDREFIRRRLSESIQATV